MTFRASFVALTVVAVLCAGVSTVTAQTAALKTPASLSEKAPATFKVKFDTSAGVFVIEVTRAWAPLGADRFYNLVKNGYYNECRFFRVIQGFMVQFGINGDPAVARVWQGSTLGIDPVVQSNKRGTITYAMGRTPDTRTTQVFINFGDNVRLDGMGFAPFGQVVSGMDVVEKIYPGYGEGAPSGQGPNQSRIQTEGNAYLAKDFPKLDFIKTATIEK